MQLINNYNAPYVDDLLKLKEQLGYTGTQMAELAGVAGSSQWRKYTSGSPRAISSHILFYIAAQLALDDEELQRIIHKMKAIGSTFE